MDDFYDRTEKALGSSVIQKLQSLCFCVVGCGGTGANFAEMLVRSGAKHLSLIDGSRVQTTELNRVFSYSKADIGMPKVCALKRRLLDICSAVSIFTHFDSFRTLNNNRPDQPQGQEVRDSVYDSDVVFIATDTHDSRLAIEELCRSKTKLKYLSCGIYIDREAGENFYICSWLPRTPLECRQEEGYGPENASYAAIVQEATSMAFSMLLNHLSCPDSNFRSYFRQYDKHLFPIETTINGLSNGNR